MEKTIQAFRRFSRFYTRLLGLFNRRLLDSPLTLAQARVLFEIRAAPGVSAAKLSHALGMDRSQLSRILSGLMEKNLAQRQGSPGGRKALPLHPTPEGLHLLREIDEAADFQAAGLIGTLESQGRKRLRRALGEIETLLGNRGASPAGPPVVRIREAVSGDLGRIITQHAESYGKEYGFTGEFETYVLLGLAEYVKKDLGRSRVWMAEYDGETVGSVGIVELSGNRAQLRWMLVQSRARGLGIGKKLAKKAVAFSRDHGFQEVILWTLKDLTAARALYQSLGFRLTQEKKGKMGGRAMIEECWALDL